MSPKVDNLHLSDVELINARLRASEFPKSFHVPTLEELDALEPGDFVKIIVRPKRGRAERVWVKLDAMEGLEKNKTANFLWGWLDSIPLQADIPTRGTYIKFRYYNVAAIEAGL